MPSLTLEHVTQALNKLSLLKRQKQLTEGECAFLEVIWQESSFEEVAERTGHKPRYLETIVSQEVRSFVTQALAVGKRPVHRRHLRQFLQQHADTLQRLLEEPTRSRTPAPLPAHQLDVIGGEPPETTEFYGREKELKALGQMLIEKRCVGIIGSPGVGKSALGAQLIKSYTTGLTAPFESVVWRSIFHGPSLTELLIELLKLLDPTWPGPRASRISSSELITLVMEHLRSRQILLVLDSVEAILQGDPLSLDPYGQEYAEYGIFIRRFIEEQHESRLLLLSRKPLSHLERLAGSRRSACVMKLNGLSVEEARGFLQKRQVKDVAHWDTFVSFVQGNCQVLRQAVASLEEFFGGDIKSHIRYSLVADPYFLEAWSDQLSPSGSATPLDRWVISFVAQQIEQGIDPVPLKRLLDEQFPGRPAELLITIKHLEQTDLLLKTQEKAEVSLSLHPLLKKYLLPQLVGLTGPSP